MSIPRIVILLAFCALFLAAPVSAEQISRKDLNYRESAFRFDLAFTDLSMKDRLGRERIRYWPISGVFSIRARLFDRLNLVFEAPWSHVAFSDPCFLADELCNYGESETGSQYVGLEFYDLGGWLMIEGGLHWPVFDGYGLAPFAGSLSRPTVPAAFWDNRVFGHVMGNVHFRYLDSAVVVRVRLGPDLSFARSRSGEDQYYMRYGIGVYGDWRQFSGSLAWEGLTEIDRPAHYLDRDVNEITASLSYHFLQFESGITFMVPMSDLFQDYFNKSIGFFVSATL